VEKDKDKLMEAEELSGGGTMKKVINVLKKYPPFKPSFRGKSVFSSLLSGVH
jgi:hypothetical protein